MRILSLVVAGVLVLSFSASGSLAEASPGAANGDAKAPAKREQPKATPTANKEKQKTSSVVKPGGKSDASNFGSAARQELLKNRPKAGAPSAKAKLMAPKGKAKAKS